MVGPRSARERCSAVSRSAGVKGDLEGQLAVMDWVLAVDVVELGEGLEGEVVDA